MSLKNFSIFLGIPHGDMIELRDYDDIADLEDGTEVLIFEAPDIDEEMQKLIEKYRYCDKEMRFVRDCVLNNNQDFLKNLGYKRRAKITKTDKGSELLFRKGRLRAIKKPRKIQKIPN